MKSTALIGWIVTGSSYQGRLVRDAHDIETIDRRLNAIAKRRHGGGATIYAAALWRRPDGAYYVSCGDHDDGPTGLDPTCLRSGYGADAAVRRATEWLGNRPAAWRKKLDKDLGIAALMLSKKLPLLDAIAAAKTRMSAATAELDAVTGALQEAIKLYADRVDFPGKDQLTARQRVAWENKEKAEKTLSTTEELLRELEGGKKYLWEKKKAEKNKNARKSRRAAHWE